MELRILAQADANIPAVGKLLKEERWDALHYCGHAEFAPKDRQSSGLLLKDGTLTAGKLREMAGPEGMQLPPLVFLNACKSAGVRDGGAEEVDPVPASLAAEILACDPWALIGTFWKVRDDAAMTFAETLYTALCTGETLGDAMILARTRLFKAGNSDWANYILYGNTELRW